MIHYQNSYARSHGNTSRFIFHTVPLGMPGAANDEYENSLRVIDVEREEILKVIHEVDNNEGEYSSLPEDLKKAMRAIACNALDRLSSNTIKLFSRAKI